VGTIFEGSTQNRASENSGVYISGTNKINVRCVHQTHGINRGAEMKYGDIAPMSVTVNLMSGAGQSAVWESVRRYTRGDSNVQRYGSDTPYGTSFVGATFTSLGSPTCSTGRRRAYGLRAYDTGETSWNVPIGDSSGISLEFYRGHGTTGNDDLLGHLNAGKKALDDMMQRAPLFKHQCGAVIFSPVGVIAVETFDHPKSWEAIKKEVVEKHGDLVKDEQAEILFELKPEMIKPAFQKFINGLDVYKEKTVRKDNLSETRVVTGNGLVGEYTLVKGRVIHTILARERK